MCDTRSSQAAAIIHQDISRLLITTAGSWAWVRGGWILDIICWAPAPAGGWRQHEAPRKSRLILHAASAALAHVSRVTSHVSRAPATTNQPAPVWCRLEAPQVPTESIKSCSVAEWVRWRPYIPGCSSHSTNIVNNNNNSNSDNDFIFPHTTIF